MRNQLETIIISKQAIKPSSPTPSHLKTYNLSFIDNVVPSEFVPLVFFYPYSGPTPTVTTHHEKSSQLLKKSLSQTLTNYYPFSGRLVAAPDGSYVDCNDEGVEFVEARVNAQLSQVVQSQDHLFFPTGAVWGCAYNSLVKVQLSYFICGGTALAVSLSHKIGDACTLYTFVKHWAAMCHNHYHPDQPTVEPLPPHIISSTKFVSSEIKSPKGNKFVSMRFVFPNSKIELLKAEVGIENSTRVEVVTSLLYRCAVNATTANRVSFYKAFVLLQTVNMRKKLASPLQETTVGNFSSGIKVPFVGKSRLALNSITDGIQKAKSKLAGTTISQLDEWYKKALFIYKCSDYVPRTLYELFACTSLCGYQVYRVDFGWGKPNRVTFPGRDQHFMLMDTPSEDGIEALVSLKEEDMAIFQADEQLLSFAFSA